MVRSTSGECFLGGQDAQRRAEGADRWCNPLSRFLASQLVEISPTDPLSFVSSVAIIVAAALLAALIPAARAAAADPAEALRAE
ncbi:MAG: hypothetical protein WD825_01445 [Gemmatimonadaceae bacterium]